MTLSVCLIVLNEEAVLSRCLDCVKKFADEIVIVDTGSEDSSLKIAAGYTDKLFNFKWNDDFSEARNFSFSKATEELIMWLDADDIVPDESIAKIIALKDGMKDYDMAFLPYRTESGDGELTYIRERIFRREKHFEWKGFVHECITPRGRIYNSDATILHRKIKSNPPMRNLLLYLKHISAGYKLNAREKFYYGRELFFNKLYTESFAVLNDFLEGDGWAENKKDACITLYYCAEALGKDGTGYLYKSFCFGGIRSEACCILGGISFGKKEYAVAELWYKIALNNGGEEYGGGFADRKWSGYIPSIMLCVIKDREGDKKQAIEYNERAAYFRPDDKYVEYNRKYFSESEKI